MSKATGMEGDGSSFMGNASHLRKNIFCCRSHVVEAGLKAGGEATLARVMEELPRGQELMAPPSPCLRW